MVALAVGCAVGYAASMPYTGDLEEQLTGSQAEASNLRAELAQVERDLSQLQSDLDAATAALSDAESATDDASDASDECSKAATDAQELIDQHEALWEDFGAYIEAPVGSPEEAELEQQLADANAEINARQKVVTEELARCQVAVEA